MSESRGGAIRASTQVQVCTGQSRRGQEKRTLRQARRVLRPKHGRSTRSTTWRSFTFGRPRNRGTRGAHLLLDVNDEQPAGEVVDAEHPHVGMSSEYLADSGS